MDASKLCAVLGDKPVILIPTSSATCASYAPLSVTYNEIGQPLGTKHHNREVNCVLCDMEILSKQPARLFKSGVYDSLAKLMELNQHGKMQQIEYHLANGVDIPFSDGVIIEPGVEIGADTQILPNTIIQGNTKIGKGCRIGPNSIISDSIIEDGAKLNNVQCYQSRVLVDANIGPFVHIRPNSVIGEKVHLGNFVEVKNSTVDAGSKLPHLLYVGDSDVGKDVNFGCGCVTVNYDGRNKSRTTVKDGAFIGCNTNLVAPVTVGENAFTAAGSTITEDVPDNALALARTRQVVKKDWVTIKKPYKRQHIK